MNSLEEFSRPLQVLGYLDEETKNYLPPPPFGFVLLLGKGSYFINTRVSRSLWDIGCCSRDDQILLQEVGMRSGKIRKQPLNVILIIASEFFLFSIFILYFFLSM